MDKLRLLAAVWIVCVGATGAYADGTPNVVVEPYRTLIDQTIQVRAGAHARYELTLNKGDKLIAQFQVSGGLNKTAKVWLLDADNYRRYASRQQFNYFQGTSGNVKGTGSYTFPIPQTNIYELVVDNGAALMLSRRVHLYVYEVFQSPTPESEREANVLQQTYDGLKQILVFKDFNITVRHCGVENAFSNPNITLCAELDESLTKNRMDMAMPFILFHELGHTLLRLWDYPLADNEDVADEFSTVIFLMAKKTEPPLTAARWFSSQTSQQEALSKIWINDRHTISPQRARNIIRWINEPDDELRKWQKLLVPNMQTAALQSLDHDTSSWVDHRFVRAELERRSALASDKK